MTLVLNLTVVEVWHKLEQLEGKEMSCPSMAYLSLVCWVFEEVFRDRRLETACHYLEVAGPNV